MNGIMIGIEKKSYEKRTWGAMRHVRPSLGYSASQKKKFKPEQRKREIYTALKDAEQWGNLEVGGEGNRNNRVGKVAPRKNKSSSTQALSADSPQLHTGCQPSANPSSLP